MIEATTDGFWGVRATLNSKSLKSGKWSGANFLGKVLDEVRVNMRREIGLPVNDQANAPQGMSSAEKQTPTPSTLPGNPPPEMQANKQQQQQNTTECAAVASNQPAHEPKSQSHSQGQSQNSKKNKIHQSPIPTPSSDSNSPTTGQSKKAQILSPKSQLPPPSFIAGDLFSRPTESLDMEIGGSMV